VALQWISGSTVTDHSSHIGRHPKPFISFSVPLAARPKSLLSFLISTTTWSTSYPVHPFINSVSLCRVKYSPPAVAKGGAKSLP
jgi:hypothetical protein